MVFGPYGGTPISTGGSIARRATRSARRAAVFNRGARDGDRDGRVQDETEFERPAPDVDVEEPSKQNFSQLFDAEQTATSSKPSSGKSGPSGKPSSSGGGQKPFGFAPLAPPKPKWRSKLPKVRKNYRPTTEEMYKNPKSGRYIKSRRKLHKEIVDKFRSQAGERKPEGQRTAYIMGGGPASGKSTALESGAMRIPKGIFRLDPDSIKEDLPDYRQAVANGQKDAAARVHKESKHIHALASEALLRDGVDVIYDSTGDGNYPGFKSRVENMRKHGHRIVAHYTTNSVETALRLNEERYLETGRKVPEYDVAHIHGQVSRVVKQALDDDLFDKFYLYDTDDLDSPPKLIAKKTRGKDLQILDQEAWDKFLAKGFPPKPPRSSSRSGSGKGRDKKRSRSKRGKLSRMFDLWDDEYLREELRQAKEETGDVF